jgi:multidrug transporter EmrE-like cation transporter
MREFLAISIAIVAALLLNYSIYLQKKAVGALPEVKARLSWATVKAFITNKPWLLAQTFNVSGFVLYSVALALAPVSIVEPIIASGVVLLAYLAIRNLGEKPRVIDYYAMSASVLGVILLGVSLAEGLQKDALRHPIEIWAVAGGILSLAVIIPLLMRGGSGNKQAAGLGISVGLFFGTAAVFQRLLMINLGHDWALAGIFVVLCIATYLPAFIILQAALQKGMAMIVAPIYNGLMEFVPIVLGMAVLNEGFPQSNLLRVFRILAFALILAGTVVLSQRAEGEVGAPRTAEAPQPEGSSTAGSS